MQIFYLIILSILQFLAIMLPILICVAYTTLVEREVLASIQRRKGPNIIGFAGSLQPLSDGLKLMLKEIILPTNIDKFLFILSPIITFTCTMLYWSVLTFAKGINFNDFNLSLLFIYLISSLSLFGILIAGWASNAKYSFLGSIRSISQMISYELPIGTIFSVIYLCTGSLNINKIILLQKYVWFFLPLFPLFIILFISLLAECNRHPFDLPESEAELVSGFNTEYSAMSFALFFIGEYGNIINMSVLITILFFGGWLPLFNLKIIPGIVWLFLKSSFFVILYVVARGAFIRFRYDQLINLSWKILLPLSLCYFLIILSILLSFNCLPNTILF